MVLRLDISAALRCLLPLRSVYVPAFPVSGYPISFYVYSDISCSFVLQLSYIFTVGYHELSGTKVQLKKPLLVLKKKAAVGAAGPEFPASSATELEVIGIIRQKILFKTRPKALISRKNISSSKILIFLEI